MMAAQYAAAAQQYYKHIAGSYDIVKKQISGISPPSKLNSIAEDHCINPVSISPLRNCSSPRRVYSPRPMHFINQSFLGTISPNNVVFGQKAGQQEDPTNYAQHDSAVLANPYLHMENI